MTRDHDATAAQRGSRSMLMRAGLIASCAMLLAGCNTHTRSNDITALAPGDYRQRHPIVVKEKEHTVELFIGNGRGGLMPNQRSEVMAFARSWRQEATGGVIIDVPVGTRNAAAAGGAVHEVQSIFRAAGIPPSGVAIRGYRPPNPRQLATVKLNYPRMAAEAGPCGLWPGDLGPSNKNYRQNRPYWNLGCASQRNLAAMVANPADLVQPRSEGPVDQTRRTRVLDAYGKGEQTSSKAPNNDAAKISDVGK